jgi:hypothetical protein
MSMTAKSTVFGSFDPANLEAIKAECFTVAEYALKGIAKQSTAKDSASEKVNSFNRDVAVITARAIVGGFFAELSEKMQKHGNYPYFKGTISTVKGLVSDCKLGKEFFVPESKKGNKTWVICGKIIAENYPIPGKDILASVLSGDSADTSPLVFAKTASAVRGLERSALADKEAHETAALTAWLHSDEGLPFLTKGMTADDVAAQYIEAKDPVGLAGIVAKGEARLNQAKERAKTLEAQANRATYELSLVGYLSANMTPEMAEKLEGILSTYRAAQVATEQPAQVAQSIAA